MPFTWRAWDLEPLEPTGTHNGPLIIIRESAKECDVYNRH